MATLNTDVEMLEAVRANPNGFMDVTVKKDPATNKPMEFRGVVYGAVVYNLKNNKKNSKLNSAFMHYRHARACQDRLQQRPKCRTFKKGAHRQVHPKPFTQSRQQLRRKQRVTPQSKKIVAVGHRFHA